MSANETGGDVSLMPVAAIAAGAQDADRKSVV